MNFNLADRLIALRRKMNYTQEEAANLIGVNKDTLFLWEIGEKTPSSDEIEKIAKVYHCDEAELKVKDDKKPSKNKNNKKKNDFIMWLTTSFFSLLCVTAFLWLGFGYNLWHPAWLLFLLIPVVASIGKCIISKSAKYFCYPILLVVVYLYFGFSLELWHPLWIIFLTIPAYYVLAKGVSILLRKDD